MAYLFCHEHINIKTFHTNYISYLQKIMMYLVKNYHLKPLSPHIRHTAFVRKLLFFLVNICVFCNLSAQTLPLSGTILDEKEECIPGVYLIAVNPETSKCLQPQPQVLMVNMFFLLYPCHSYSMPPISVTRV